MAEGASSHAEACEKLEKLIQGIKVAMMSTIEEDGSIRSRPMWTQQHKFDGTIWFFTSVNSGKMNEIAMDQHVNLSYADPDSNRYVSISGKARHVRDKEKARELWNPAMKAWFPEGLDDPELTLLRVDVESAEYWDSPSSKIATLIGFVKAVATGQRYEPGEHDKVNF